VPTSMLADTRSDTLVTETIDASTVPWVFTDFEDEYNRLRQGRGVFDLTSLGRIRVEGPRALAYLQRVLARDIEYLFPERCLTSLVLDDAAHPVDIVVVHKVQGGYLIETSFGRAPSTLAHLQAQASDDVEVRDVSEEAVVIGLEGPFAWDLVKQVFDPQLTGLPFQGVASSSWSGEEFMVTRTGYTGEYGYKFHLTPDLARKAWTVLAQDAPPVGFQALEVSMLEMRQSMIHREVGPDDDVIACGLNPLVEIDKDDFVGKDALAAQREAGVPVRTLGFTAEGDADVPAEGATVLAGGELEIGRVVYAVRSPGMGKAIGLIRVDTEWAAHGLDLEITDGNGQATPVRTVPSPFVIPLSWTIPIL